MGEEREGYKILIILIIFSIIFMIIFLISCLIDLKTIIIFGLSIGFASELYSLRLMIESLKSRDKWIIVVDFNYYHEGIFEIIFFIIVSMIEFLAIIIAFTLI